MTKSTTRTKLSVGALVIVQEASSLKKSHKHEELGVNHWLMSLLRRHGQMAADYVKGLDPAALSKQVQERLEQGEIGDPLDEALLLEVINRRANEQGKEKASERDLVIEVLRRAGYRVNETSGREDRSAAPERKEGHPGTASWRGRAKHEIPTLEKYGRDLTAVAVRGELPRIVGRDREIELIQRVLCRRTKRNPALVGPAGVGKTAIIEGLAQRIVSEDVPQPLIGLRLIELQPSNLTAGAGIMGELQRRMKAVISEASQDGIVLFIDELHSIVGAGGGRGTEDVGSLLKPALARGELACIGATTDDEYRRYIEPDRALERRFNPIAVHEMTPEDTFPVLSAHRDKLTELRGIEVSDEILHFLVGFAKEYLQTRTFPDKAVDLLEQCVANAVVKGKSAVDLGQAQELVQELVGIPIDLNTRLHSLESEIDGLGLLSQEDNGALIDRLQVTMRGLDMRPLRPAATLLLAGEIAASVDLLAGTLAMCLFGSADRVVDIDFGQFDNPSDVNTLVGPPPGYIGFEGRRPLHRVSQMPWCILICRNVQGCHPEVREVLGQALADGVVRERGGGRIYLSDAVVLMTAPVGVTARRRIGLIADEGVLSDDLKQTLDRELGTQFVDQIDLFFTSAPASVEGKRKWVKQAVLKHLSRQYRGRRVDLEWNDSFILWVVDQERLYPTKTGLTRFVEERVGEAVIPLLPAPGEEKVSLLVTVNEGRIEVVSKDRSSPA